MQLLRRFIIWRNMKAFSLPLHKVRSIPTQWATSDQLLGDALHAYALPVDTHMADF